MKQTQGPSIGNNHTILNLCKEEYLSIRDIAAILHRTPDTLQIHTKKFLTPVCICCERKETCTDDRHACDPV